MGIPSSLCLSHKAGLISNGVTHEVLICFVLKDPWIRHTKEFAK